MPTVHDGSPWYPSAVAGRPQDSYDMLRSDSVFLSPESRCPTWNEALRRYVDVKRCLSSWKDLVIPGHTEPRSKAPPKMPTVFQGSGVHGFGYFGPFGDLAMFVYPLGDTNRMNQSDDGLN